MTLTVPNPDPTAAAHQLTEDEQVPEDDGLHVRPLHLDRHLLPRVAQHRLVHLPTRDSRLSAKSHLMSQSAEHAGPPTSTKYVILKLVPTGIGG